MQARTPQQIARELALLSLSQLPTSSKQFTEEQMPRLVIEAVRTLKEEVQETLSNATAELQRSNDRLLTSQTRAVNMDSVRKMVKDAVECTQTAINQLGATVDLSELIAMSNQKQVRDYVITLINTVNENRQAIDEVISAALVDWQVERLARIDRDMLRIAVAEMKFLDVHEKPAINEAVELAKRYSGEDGFRFINGVLRRVSEQAKAEMLTVDG
jgi:transcription antitermination protein NusB